MFKFLHAADIHLDSPLKGLERYEDAPVDEVRLASRHALENLIELALDEEVEFVLLAGDIFNGDWRCHSTGLFFVGQMNRLREADIEVHLVAGNHDAVSQITKKLRLPSNVTFYGHRKPQREIREKLGVVIHGQSFGQRSVSENLAEGFPPCEPGLLNIGLLHTSLDGRPPHANYAPCNLATLQSKGYAYWALGHVHQREVVSCDPWVVFPGTIQGRHVRESGAKGCTLVTVEDGEITDVAARELDVLRWATVSVDLEDAESGDATIDAVQGALEAQQEMADDRLLAARLVLEGASAAHEELTRNPERWVQEYRAQASALPGAGCWVEAVKFRTRSLSRPGLGLENDNALGGLLKMIDGLETGATDLENLGEGFSDLKSKLPIEITSGDEPLDPTDPAILKEALEDVKAMLVQRLLGDRGQG